MTRCPETCFPDGGGQCCRPAGHGGRHELGPYRASDDDELSAVREAERQLVRYLGRLRWGTGMSEADVDRVLNDYRKAADHPALTAQQGDSAPNE